MAKQTRPKNLIGSVDKAINILKFLARRSNGATLMEVSKEFGWPHSTVHHLLATLRYHGFVQQIPPGKRYHLGMSLFELGQRVLENFDLVELSLPYLRQLTDETRETSNLAVLDGLDVINLAQVPSQYLMKALSRVGGRVPAYCTALGKCLLSGKSDEEITHLYNGVALEPLTPNTATCVEDIVSAVHRIREQGYGVDDQEREPNVRCIAAPIVVNSGLVLAAVSISGPISRLMPDDDHAIGAVKSCARAISDGIRQL